MKNVKYLLGNEDVVPLPIVPFAEDTVNFLNDLSVALFKSTKIRAFPDVSALAFWCRRANINKIKKTYPDRSNRLGRGLCFHIAPSNIPINFAFSYVFSLLAGNANIVRLPSRQLPQVDFLIEEIRRIIEDYPEIMKRTAFVSYSRDSNATEQFTTIADCRMIWGGDQTIATVRKLSTKPQCVDISFSDRYSIVIINGLKILSTDVRGLRRLAENFYNDTYLIDQNACSSPQLVYWINESELARSKFWTEVAKVVKQKYELQDAIAVDKYTQMCQDAMHSTIVGRTSCDTNRLYRSEILELTKDMENIRGIGGYFYEYVLTEYSELMAVVTEKYQTATYFGINPDVLKESVIASQAKGIDRIVPIGKALDIDVIWDGHDLIRELSRILVVQ